MTQQWIYTTHGIGSSMEQRQQEDSQCGSPVSPFGVLGNILSIHRLNWKRLLQPILPKVPNSLIHSLCSECFPKQGDSESWGCISLRKKIKSLITQSDFCFPAEVTEAFFPSISSIHFHVLHKITPISTVSDWVGVLSFLWLLFILVF